MNLEKSQLNQLGNLIQSGKSLSENIAEISGQDKVTVTLVAAGITLLTAGLLRAVSV